MWRAFAEGSGPRLCMREQAPSRGHLFLRGFKKMLIRKARIGSGERRAWGGERKAHGGGLSTCGGGGVCGEDAAWSSVSITRSTL